MDRNAALRQFLERLVEGESALRKELEDDPAGVVARETGMTLTELRQQIQLLTDDELAAVAGGRSSTVICPNCKKAIPNDIVGNMLHHIFCGNW